MRIIIIMIIILLLAERAQSNRLRMRSGGPTASMSIRSDGMPRRCGRSVVSRRGNGPLGAIDGVPISTADRHAHWGRLHDRRAPLEDAAAQRGEALRGGSSAARVSKGRRGPLASDPIGVRSHGRRHDVRVASSRVASFAPRRSSPPTNSADLVAVTSSARPPVGPVNDDVTRELIPRPKR